MELLTSRVYPKPTPLELWELTPGDKNLDAIMFLGISGNGHQDEHYEDDLETVLKFRRAIFRNQTFGQAELIEIYRHVQNKAEEEGTANEYNRWKRVADWSAGRHTTEPWLNHLHGKRELLYLGREFGADEWLARDPKVPRQNQPANAPLREDDETKEILDKYNPSRDNTNRFEEMIQKILQTFTEVDADGQRVPRSLTPEQRSDDALSLPSNGSQQQSRGSSSSSQQ